MGEVIKSLSGHYRDIILGPLFKLAEAIFELMVPLVVAVAINHGILAQNRVLLLRQAALLFLLATLGIACSIIGQYFAAKSAGDVAQILRDRVFEKALRLTPAQVLKLGTGHLVNLVTSDINQVGQGLNRVTRLGARVPFVAIGGVVMALSIDRRIGLIFLLCVCLFVLVMMALIRYTLPAYLRVQREQDDLGAHLRDGLMGLRTIRAFGRTVDEQNALWKMGEALMASIIKVGKIAALMTPSAVLLMNLALAAALWFGAGFVDLGRLQVGDVVALTSYMMSVLMVVGAAVLLVIDATRATASAKRVGALLAYEELAPGDVENLSQEADVLACKEASFSYGGGENVALADISFSLRAGETLGVIGGTGSGKSTLVALCLGLLPPCRGDVFYRGTAIAAVAPHVLRGEVGFAPQNVRLFRGSIAENLRMARAGATEEELWRALETAQAADFVRKQAEGLETQLTENGRNLSGGQRQRLAIARAVLQAEALLVLDDSFSALDYTTGQKLSQALAEDLAGRTKILVSQRVSALAHADRILVLENGRMCGLGTHRELLADCAVYEEICRIQGIGGALS